MDFPDLIPAGKRLAVENVWFHCTSQTSKGGSGPVYVFLDGYLGSADQIKLVYLPFSSPGTDGAGNQVINGSWNGRTYFDHQTGDPHRLFSGMSGAFGGAATDCYAYVSGYLVSMP
jgi:hypothetical protein